MRIARHDRGHIRHHRERIIAKWRRYRDMWVITPEYQLEGRRPVDYSWWFVEGRFPKMNSHLSGCRCSMHRAIQWDTRYHRHKARVEEQRVIVQGLADTYTRPECEFWPGEGEDAGVWFE